MAFWRWFSQLPKVGYVNPLEGISRVGRGWGVRWLVKIPRTVGSNEGRGLGRVGLGCHLALRWVGLGHWKCRVANTGEIKTPEDVFPIKHGDIPLLCSFTGGYLDVSLEVLVKWKKTPETTWRMGSQSRWWQLKYFLECSPLNLGKWSNLTNMFQMGWNHQPRKKNTWNYTPQRWTNGTWKWWFGSDDVAKFQGARILRFHVSLSGCTWMSRR